MKILILGATGVVGKATLHWVLEEIRVAQVIAPTRRSLPAHPKLLNPVAPSLDLLLPEAAGWAVDAVICAMGTTIRKAGSKAAFRHVDYELPIAFSERASGSGASALALVSSPGASLTITNFRSVALAAAKAAGKLEPSDRIFIDFLAYAGTSVEELVASTKLEDLKAKCEGASNKISDEIFEYWTQNDALAVKIDIAAGLPEDEPPMNSGNVAKAWITNRHHRASVPLFERSAGFVWFFSFLAQFKQLKKTTGKAIILLDEPGLTLHGRAQADLLRYIEERLLPDHQVIFTTHSPFMVPSDRLADVLIVEDVVKYDQRQRATVEGTKVRDDVLLVSKDTLFPLQGALGYDLTQSLFVGKNTLLVEGPSDILYLQALSSALAQRKRTGLDPRWTLCPGGGIDKIASFASLFGANRLNLAVLCDVAVGEKAKIEKLRKHQLLEADQVFTIADFTEQEESDVEDLFPHEKYAELLNETFGLKDRNKLTAERLQATDAATQRVVKQAEAAFRVMPADVEEFDHFSPSGWLIRHPEFLDAEDADTATALDRAEKLFETFNALLERK